MIVQEEETGTAEPIEVLIVDDDPFTLRLLERCLQAEGCQVFTAPSGEEGLRLYLEKGPPIVITDLNMPGMDGLELCRAIRQHEAASFTLIIMLTATQDEQRFLEAFHAGADDYITKPFKCKHLQVRMRSWKRIVRLERELIRRSRSVHRANAELAVVNARLKMAAVTDELTGLPNRRAALQRLEEYWAASVRRDTPLACIAIDVDHFKHVNDTWGHSIGDEVLKGIATLLRRSTRAHELVARIGGEEFLVLCPQARAEDAAEAAERLRHVIDAHLFETAAGPLHVTISLGVADRTPQMRASKDLIRAADDALYAAKQAGRNCVRLYGRHTPQPASPTPDPPSRLPCEQCAAAHVLVADPDDWRRLKTAQALEAQGLANVTTCPFDGLPARLYHDPAPDVILISTERVDETCCALLRQIRAHPAGEACLTAVLIGRESEEAAITAYEAGADLCLWRPRSEHVLVWTVRSLARLQHSRRELAASNEVRGRQAVMLTALLDYSRDIAGMHDVDMAVQRTALAVATVLRARRVGIFLPDAEGRLHLAGGLGLADGDQPTRLSASDPLARAGLEATEPLIVETPPPQPGDAGPEHPEHDGARLADLFSLPLLLARLRSANHAVGLIALSDRQGGAPFDAGDIEYADMLCGIAGAAICEMLALRARDRARDSIVVGLARLAEHRDDMTGRHLDRVTGFCELLARQLRTHPAYRGLIDDEFIANLRRAVPLHDIGKVGIRDHILLKPGPLTDEQRGIMQRHAELGARCIEKVMQTAPDVPFLHMARDIAHAHHEWFDGSGYPQGLKGEQIPLAARIAALADVYDALTTRRPYKEPFSHEKARDIILQGAGRQFDPHVVEAFLAVEDEFRRLAAEAADEPHSEPPDNPRAELHDHRHAEIDAQPRSKPVGEHHSDTPGDPSPTSATHAPQPAQT